MLACRGKFPKNENTNVARDVIVKHGINNLYTKNDHHINILAETVKQTSYILKNNAKYHTSICTDKRSHFNKTILYK